MARQGSARRGKQLKTTANEMTHDTIINEAEIDRALDYLRDNATSAAKARAERVYVEEFRKSLKAQIMQEHDKLPVSAQEREAYADRRYIEFLDGLKQAVFEDEKHRFLLAAASAKIDAWRTLQANERGQMRI